MNIWEHNLQQANKKINDAKALEERIVLEELNLLRDIDKAHKALGQFYIDKQYAQAKVAAIELGRKASKLAMILPKHDEAFGAIDRAIKAFKSLWNPAKAVKPREAPEPQGIDYTG
jgi:hypothetical protein